MALRIVLVLTFVPATVWADTICAIDMGSNTFRRIVGSFADGRYTQTSMEPRPVGVGDDLARHGRISDEKLAEIERVLSAFKASCDRDGASEPLAIGTAAFRDAPNGRRVVALAGTLGIRMEIATETRESELAYLVGSLGADGYAVIDNGSRSIELVAREAGKTPHLVFNLGYRVAYDTFFANAPDAAAAITAFSNQLRTHASPATFMTGKKKLVGVEYGDMTEVFFPGTAVEGRVLTLEMLRGKLRETTTGPDAFSALKQTKDIDRALPRLVAAIVLMEQFGYPQLELTARELGTGLIIEAGIAAK